MSVSFKENIPLYEKQMADIIIHVTLEEIILFCSRNEVWNFLNFQLLQDLADHFEVEQLKTRLQNYSIAVVFSNETQSLLISYVSGLVEIHSKHFLTVKQSVLS